MRIVKQAEKLLTNQDYTPSLKIEGVSLLEIKRFIGEDGVFAEVVRVKKGKIIQPEAFSFFEVKQVNYSQVLPKIVKAWHLHLGQDEIWFVHPEGRLIGGLLDLREDSKTKNLKMRVILGGGKAHLLYIPRGVAHGLSNPYLAPASMTYLVNNYFNGSDEKRLPSNFGVEEDFWEIKKG
jgi:dTDP-4-dehydrorhamnose 3,5-epimerase-like enzyme